VQNVFFWILVALGPSLAAVAWLAWYSGALENTGQDQHEPWIGS